MTETATAVRERPILFSGPMVRAILAGTKTQTRRVVKPQPGPTTTSYWPLTNAFKPIRSLPDYDGEIGSESHHRALDAFYSDDNTTLRCPYGNVGDRLWVRESACISPPDFADTSLNNVLGSDGRWRVVQYVATHPDTSYARDYGIKVTPSIHMPRWASRLTLELSGVRVERLQAITEADAEAEGVGEAPIHGRRELYATLWDRLNAQRGYPWSASPWVWVLEFKRVE